MLFKEGYFKCCLKRDILNAVQRDLLFKEGYFNFIYYFIYTNMPILFLACIGTLGMPYQSMGCEMQKIV